MIDTHAHLDFKDFNQDREEVISRAFNNGVRKIINIGVDLATSEESVKLAEGHANIFASVGFHPHDAEEILNSANENDFSKLKELAKHKKVVAMGETGLDYSRFNGADQIKKQKKLFIEQLNIAEELNLPVVIHCRDAWKDLYGIISGRSNNKFVLHCYSGNREDTEKFLKLPNVWFSFSGNITYPKPAERAQILAEAVRRVPLERIMLDTDCPFLAPQAERGKRNEPANARHIAERIAQIKEIFPKNVEKQTDSNAESFFSLV